MTTLDLDGISKRFDDTAALEDVSLRVAAGEFFTLVGPSGCGKTTTLRIVAGLTEPEEGTVRIDGEAMSGVPPEDRDVGIVFQDYALFPHLTVAENIAYGLRFEDPPGGGRVEDRVAELLALVDLERFGDRDPESLSGGQRQRVALARALAPGPDLLLLDEPMSALDARLRERLRRTVKRIQTELGITTVYVTHDQAEALAISDRIAVLSDGRVEQVGAPEAVYREPANRFVAGFVGDNNLFAVRSVDDGVAITDCGATIAVEGASPGDTLAIRPEALHLGTDDTTLEPTVESVAFHGTGYTLHCKLGDRELLVDADRRPEAPITVGVPSEAVQVLPVESDGRPDV